MFPHPPHYHLFSRGHLWEWPQFCVYLYNRWAHVSFKTKNNSAYILLEWAHWNYVLLDQTGMKINVTLTSEFGPSTDQWHHFPLLVTFSFNPHPLIIIIHKPKQQIYSCLVMEFIPEVILNLLNVAILINCVKKQMTYTLTYNLCRKTSGKLSK